MAEKFNLEDLCHTDTAVPQTDWWGYPLFHTSQTLPSQPADSLYLTWPDFVMKRSNGCWNRWCAWRIRTRYWQLDKLSANTISRLESRWDRPGHTALACPFNVLKQFCLLWSELGSIIKLTLPSQNVKMLSNSSLTSHELHIIRLWFYWYTCIPVK